MPVIQVYQHGVTAGVPPTKNDHQRGQRGNVGGWSDRSARSNTRFLYSVLENQLSGVGFALTLTVRDCPATHDDWKAIREAFMVRLRRMGLIRAHWVTEWQRRGVPHLHCAIWLPEPDTATLILANHSGRTLTTTMERYRLCADILTHWQQVAPGASPAAQHVLPITDSVGWFQYLSKHAARGARHYQRCAENIPVGWQKTGRMWGYIGDWPRREATRLVLDRDGYFRFRRMVRAYRLAQARHSVAQATTSTAHRQARRRVEQARRMLACPDRERSEVRGVSNWIEADTCLHMIAAVAAQGYEIRHD